MKYLPLIWHGIWRRPGRTLLVVLQIVVAFGLFGMMQGMKSGMDAAIRAIAADVYVVVRATGAAPLPLAHQARIAAVPGVRSIEPQAFLGGTYQKPDQQLFSMATDVPLWARNKTDEKVGFVVAPEALAAMARTRNGALIGEGVVKKYHFKVGDRVPVQSQLPQMDGSKDWIFEIVGVFQDDEALGFANLMVINYDYFNEARSDLKTVGQPKNTVQRYVIKVADPKQGGVISAQVDKLFTNSPDETRTEAMAEQAQAQMQSIGDVDFLVRSVVAAVMFALLFATATMMMQSIRERAPELAVLKTLGFSDRKVFWFVIVEVGLLCTLSAVIGLALAAVILPRANPIGAPVQIPLSVLLAGMAIAAALTLAAGALPAWRGLRLQVAAALAGR